MQQVNSTVYNGADNSCDFILTENDKALLSAQYTAITRVQVWINGAVAIDSDVNPEWFTWGSGHDQVDIKMGHAGLAAGAHIAYLKVFDAGNTNGIRWDMIINLTVVDP